MSITINQIGQHFYDVLNGVPGGVPGSFGDRKIYGGDHDREVKKIGIGWVPCSQNLETAGADGCDLFISHENIFYGPWAQDLDSSETVWGRRRMSILKKNDMAWFNLHDTWDCFPEYGIRDSWMKFLDLTELLEERPYYRGSGKVTATKFLALSRVKTQSFGEFASFVARKCSVFPSSQGVTIHGNRNAEIRTVATGAGCCIPTLEMLELGADVLVLTFDRAMQTTIRIPLIEMNANILVVEHGTSEMPGMQSMAVYLNKTFPDIEATFYCKEPMAETILPEVL